MEEGTSSHRCGYYQEEKGSSVHIRGTQELGVRLEATNIPEVISYIDASYGVHKDFKSYTGSTVGIGKGPLCSKSSTRKN